MTVHIDTQVCKGCGLCGFYCARDVLVLSNRRNEKGYYVAEAVNQDECFACKLCEVSCPDLAIYVAENPTGSTARSAAEESPPF